MRDLIERQNKLISDAEDCDLIANLTDDVEKKKTFRDLAMKLRVMAEELRPQIDARRKTEG